MYKKLLLLIPLLFLISCDKADTTEFSSYIVTVDSQGDELVIGLAGEETLTVNIDSEYLEQGIEYIYEGDAEITYYITGGVNTSKLGRYVIDYAVYVNSIYWATISREIYVADMNPTISFTEPIYIEYRTENIDYLQGLTALDYVLDDILSSVEVDATSVNQNQPGKYEITYTVTDSYGYSFEINRDVFVNDYVEYIFNTETDLEDYYGNLQKTLDINVSYSDAFALDDEVMAIGAPGYQSHGAVIIYDMAGNLLQTIDGSNYIGDANHPLEFGTEVALTDQFLIVGAPNYLSPSINLGAIILFPRTGQTFDTENPIILQQDDVSQYEILGFGREFIAKDNLLLISNTETSYSSSKLAVLVYQLNSAQDEYNLIQTIYPQNNNDYNYGYHLTYENDYLAISTEVYYTESDKVYLYKFNGETFGLKETYVPGDEGHRGEFGKDVAIYENYMFISTPYDYTGGTRSGAIYMFDLAKSADEAGGMVKVCSPDNTRFEGYGKAIDIIGDYLIVTSNKLEKNEQQGKGIYIYRISDLISGDYTPIDTYLLHDQSVKGFGDALSAYEDMILIGNPSTIGHTYVSGSLEVVSFTQETISYIDTYKIDDQKNNYTITIDDEAIDHFFLPSCLEDGTYILTYMNAVGYYTTHNITYDTIAPNIGSDLIASQHSTIQIQSNELLGSYQLNDDDIILLDTPATTFSLELIENGEYTLDVYDIAGNVTTLTYIYDNEAPVVTSNLFETGDLYHEITAEQTWSFTRFGTTFDYNNDLLVAASKVSEDRDVLESYAYIFQKDGMDFTFLERITQPYTTDDNFAKQVAVNETDLFIAATVTDDLETYDVIYVYHRDSQDFSVPDGVIQLPEGTIKKMIIEDNHLVVLYRHLDLNNVCIYDVSESPYLRTDIDQLETESMNDISISNNLLAISSTESRVYIHNLDTETIRIIEQSGYLGGTSQIVLHNDMLAVKNSNSHTSTVYLYDLSLEPGFTNYKEEISLGSFNDGKSLEMNDKYLAIGNSTDDIVYLFDLSAEDMQLSKTTISSSGWFFGNHLFMNDEFLLVSNPDSSFNTYAGAISLYYLKDFYQLDIQDFSFDGEVYEVIDQLENAIPYPYIFETNVTVNILVRDLAGNEYAETNHYEDLTIEFTENYEVISETKYVIETNKYFNSYSLDNGVTYISIEPTTHYTIDGLETGEYTILVRYNDVCESVEPLLLIVDTETPILELVYDHVIDFYKNQIFQLYRFKFREEQSDFVVHEDYIIILYHETVETNLYQNKVYLFNRHLAEEDEGYLTVLESGFSTVYSPAREGSISIDGDILVFSSPEEETEYGKGAIYIYDLSEISTDNFLVDKITVPDYHLIGSKILFEDNYLFITGVTEDSFGDSVNHILVYKYIEESKTFNFESKIVCVFDGTFRHIDYDNFILAVSSNSGEISVYDLTQNSIDQQYIGTIEATRYHDHYENPNEVENVAIYDDLLVVYIEYPADVYGDETEDQDKLYFYDLKDGDFIVDYIYEINNHEENLNGLSGKSLNLQFLENGTLYVGKNYTVYDTKSLLDGISEADTIDELYMLSIPNQDAMNTPDLWLTSLYINDNDINAIIFGGWHTIYSSYTYFYQFNPNGVGFQIAEDNEYTYHVHLNGEEIDNPLNQILGVNGLYEIIIKEISGLVTKETFTLNMNAPIIISKSAFVKESYEIICDQPFTQVSIDNGLTYQTISETTSYIFTDLENGVYNILVKTSTGETSKSVKVIFDNKAPEIDILTTTVNDEEYVDTFESYFTFSDYIIYEGFIYYIDSPSSGTIYKVNLELEPYQANYETKIKRLPSDVMNMILDKDKIYIFYRQDNLFSIIDLTKEPTDEDYYEEYYTSLEINTYDDYAESVAVINNFLVVFIDYTSSTEKDDALIIYDLRLAFDDPNFETIYTPDFLTSNQYFARSLFGFEDLLIVRSYDSNVSNSFFTVYDFTVNPGDPGFETQVDLGLENVRNVANGRAFDNGKLIFSYNEIGESETNYAIIDFSKSQNESDYITYLDFSAIKYFTPKYMVLDNDLVFIYPEQVENFEKARSIYMVDLSKSTSDPTYCQELTTHVLADDEVMTSRMLVYNHQLFIYTHNYQFATLSNNYIHSIFIEEVSFMSVSDDYQVTSIVIKLDGEVIELNSLNQLTIPGVYEITVIDASGNEAVETIIITS